MKSHKRGVFPPPRGSEHSVPALSLTVAAQGTAPRTLQELEVRWLEAGAESNVLALCHAVTTLTYATTRRE